MNKQAYRGPERRKFIRLDYITPFDCKVCKKQTIDKLLHGYTTNISESGLLCNIKDPVKKNDIIWLAFDRGALGICENIERKALIYQNGIIGKVARVGHKKNNTYTVGVNFITKEEKNLTHIYPKIHFMKDCLTSVTQAEVEEEKIEEEEEEGPESGQAEPKEDLREEENEDFEKE
jgi:hypothetical protein